MEDLIGKSVWIETPVKPEHYQGYAVITNVTKTGKLKYEIEQIRSKQWYSADQFFPHESMKIITQEDIYQKHYEDKKAWIEQVEKSENKTLCDAYKEAISEATEDMKMKHSMDHGERFKRPSFTNEQLAELWNKPSTSTTMFPNGITGITSNNWGKNLDRTISGSFCPGTDKTQVTETPEDKRKFAMIKKGLALLAEQKQNEIKEIEELIKKL